MKPADVFRIVWFGLFFLPVLVPVACQSEREVPKGSPEAVFSTRNFSETLQNDTSPDQVQKKSNWEEPAEAFGEDTPTQSLSKTGRSSKGKQTRTSSNQQPVTPDLSELKSARRKIGKQVKKTRTTWPEKFDRQVQNRLQQHMKQSGWKNFEYSHNEVHEGAAQQDGPTDRRNEEKQN